MLGCCLAMLLMTAHAGDCYDESYMPMPLATNDKSGDMEYLAITGCPATGYMYLGGYSKSSNTLWGKTPPLPVITQMDLAANTYAYRRSFAMEQYNDLHAVSALQISPTCKNLAIHMTSLVGSSPEGPVSYLVVVFANDAHFASPMVRIVHNTAGVGTHTVMPDGLIFDLYDKVYLAFNHVGTTYRDSDGGVITNYAGKAVIGGYDLVAKELMFYTEQETFFGRSAALAYRNYGATAANLYVGGSVDYCRADASPGTKCWALAISRIAQDGSATGTWQLQPGAGPWTDERTAPFIDFMEFDNDRLFGTTRSSAVGSEGSGVYVFRVRVVATGDLDVTGSTLKQLDPGSLPGRSHITGVRPVLIGNIMHTILILEDLTMVYLEVDFNGNKAEGTTFYTTVAGKASFWIGDIITTKKGVDMYDAYTVGTAQSIGKTSFGGQAGLIIPTDEVRLCKGATGELNHRGYDVSQKAQTTTMSSNFKNFQTATLPPNHSFQDQLLYMTFGLVKSFLHTDTWCSRYNQAAKEIAGGQQIEKMCAWWNGETTELDFFPNEIRIPRGCSDTSLIWDYSVLVEQSGVFDPKYLQVTMDPEEFVIRATALPGPTITGTYRIQVSTTDPSMFTTTWDIEMVFQPCAKPVITSPTLVDQFYAVTGPYADYPIPAFTYSDDKCIGTEEFTNSVAPANTWISGVSDNAGLGSLVGWSTDNEVYAGTTWTVTIENFVGCLRTSVTYDIIIESQCKVLPMTIDPTGTIFPSPIAQTQYIFAPAVQLSWSEADVSYTTTYIDPLTGNLLDCGPIEFILTDFAGEPVNPALFNANFFDPQDIRTQTDDLNLIDIYPIKLTAYFVDYPMNTAEKPFNIEVADLCETPSGNAPYLPDQVYKIGTPTQTVFSSPFNYLPAYCPYTLMYTISPDPSDPNAIQFFDLSNVYELFSDSVDMIGSYTVTTTALSPSGAMTDLAFSFNVTFVDPCLDATFDIQPGILSSDPVEYRVAYPSVTETFLDGFAISSETDVDCGDIEFVLTNRDGTPVEADAWTWDPVAQTFVTETSDRSYFDDGPLYPFRLAAKYVGDKYSPAGFIDFDVLFLDPCEVPFDLASADQTVPPDYYYTGESPQVDFTLNPFVVKPAYCEIDYSCAFISGPGPNLDICNFADGALSQGVFDPVTGSYNFFSTDKTGFPPGVYVMEVKGTVGAKGVTSTVPITLVDPCPTAQLALNTSPFVDAEYVLRDPDAAQQWLADQLATIDSPIDCGPWAVEFYFDDAASTPIETMPIFMDGRDPDTENDFTTLYSEDEGYVGEYLIKYRVYPVEYPDNFIDSPEPFNITIVDPCDPPKSITAPPLEDQEYTITDLADIYQIPPFVPDPDWCGLTYTYSIETPEGDSAVTFDSDPESRTFTFENLQDILLAGGEAQSYTVTVTAEAGINTKITNSSDFNLMIKDPCLNPAFLSIESVPMPTDISYELYQFNQTGFEWPHDPFIVITQPIEHSLCGNVVYDCIFEGQLVEEENPPLAVMTDSSAMPMAHDSATNMFNFYAEDRDLIGIRDYACIAKFENYPTTASDVSAGQIEIIDPCLDPDEIQVFEQTDPPDYYYTGFVNIFELNAFQTWPPNCLFSDYSCSMVAGARLDLCNIIDGTTEGEFIPKDGSYTFKSTDVQNYPPGEYVFRITGTSGLNSDFVDITMTLVDPCPTTQLTLLEDAFVNQTYTLRDEPLIQEWLFENVVSKETNAECGPYEIEFFNDDPIQTPLDTNTFFNKDDVAPGEFTTLYTQDVDKVGVYPIRYKVRLARYPQNEIVSQVPFNITIVDPCDPPKSITAPPLEDQEYTITDLADIYQIPPFVPDPDWCGLTYTYSIETPEGDSAVTFDSDPESRTFTFENLQDILLAGGEAQNYTVTVTAEAGINTKITNSSDFNLMIKDPCLNPDFISVEVAPLLDVSYELYQFNLTGFEWTHPPFTIVTKPTQHDLCGELVYDATFEGEIIDIETRPMFYDAETQIFNLYAEDRQLVGTRTYSLLAKFKKYPSAASSVEFGKITIIDPCANPTHIVATEQQSPFPYYYTGQLVKFVMNPFETWPPVCAFNYDCTSVDGPDKDIQCNLNGNGGGWDEEFIDGGNLGTYSFASIDMRRFSPGIYNFTITGRVGLETQVEATTHFVLELRNPCPTARLLLVDDNPMANIDYFVGENPITNLFNLNTMVKLNTKVDCGPIYMELKQNFDGKLSSVNVDMFNVDQRIPSSGKFTVRQTDDLEKVGEYTFTSRFWLADHKSMKIEGDSFVVRIMSPCTPERLAIQGRWPLMCPKPKPAPIQYAEMPDWLRDLKDQEVCIGSSLEYNFGDPVSIYGDPMDVKVDYKWANRFLKYDDHFNQHEAVGITMEEDDIGYYMVTVYANYTNVHGKQVKFSNSFVQTLIPRCTPLSLIKPDDIVHYIEDWDHGIRYTEEPEPYDPTLPQPFVESLSPTGLLTVGWTQQMVTYTDYQEIQDRKVAIRPMDAELYTDKGVRQSSAEGSGKRRQLYDNWFVDKPGGLEEKIKIFDGIQVNITAADDPDREIKYTWHIQEYDEHFIYFQFDFEQPELTSEYENFDQIKITFWETKYFESGEGKQVGYGSSVIWGMYRQVSQDTADSLDSVFTFFLTGSVIVLSIVLLLLCCGGRLTPTWMFINSLSLLAHLPLLGVMMPSELHYFLYKWLQVFTLHNEAIDYAMEVWRMPLSVKNYFKAIGDESPYHIVLNDCGYKHAYARNMLILFIIGSTIFVIWLIFMVRAYIIRFFCPQYLEKEQACVGWCRDTRGCRKASSVSSSIQEKKGYRFSMLVSCRIEKDKQQKPIGWEPWWANFGIRFAYMVFFELILCVMINVSIVDFELNESLFLWLTAYFILTLVVLSIGMLTYLFFKGGPYMEHTFKEKNIISSFWGHRPLDDQTREVHRQEFEEWLVKDTEETRLFLIDQETRRRFRKRESRRFKKSFWKRITCNKKKRDKITSNRKVEDEVVEIKPAKMLFDDDAVLKKPLEKSISSDQFMQKASPTPYLDRDETAGNNPQGSSQRSLSSRGQDALMIEQMESSFSDINQRSIAIERLSRNSEQRSSPSSSASKPSKNHGSFEKIDPQIYVESQPDEHSVNRLDLKPSKVASRVQQFSSPVLSEQFQSQNQSGSSFNEQMEQIVSDTDNTPRNFQQIYEGGSAEYSAATPKQANDSRLLIQSQNGSSRQSDMSKSRDQWEVSGPPQNLDSARSVSPTSEQSERHNPYIDEYLDGIIDDTEQDGLQTDRPLMLATTTPVDLDSLAKGNYGDIMEAFNDEKVAKKLSRAQKDYLEAQEMYREIRLTPVQVEAKFRLWLSEKVQPTNRYRTLFYGLKLNTQHNVAIVQPLAYIIRRIIYSAIVVFMLNQAYFGVMFLIGTCLFFQVFVLVEKPWDSPIINQQHFVNECGLFYVLVHLVLFNGLVNDVYGRMWIGWYMIGIVCLIIVYNWIIILWHCLKIFAEMWSRHQKAYDLYWPDTWCYCCRKCNQKEPSTRYTEEPKPLALLPEPIGYEMEKQVPKTECLMGCPGGCDGFTGIRHCDQTCPHDCDGVTGPVHQKRCDHRCPPNCNGFRGVSHCTLSCAQDCDGLTGAAHMKSCQTGCSHNCQGTGVNHCDHRCATNCDGKTGAAHQVVTKKVFIEIETEPIETYIDHQETILKVPEPLEEESSCSQCCEEVQEEESLSICSFVPDDISKVSSKGSFCPDELDPREQLAQQFIVEEIVEVTPEEPSPKCSQDDSSSDQHSHEHGSNCSCNSSYEEEEITYKITERVTPGGDVITEKVEVIGEKTDGTIVTPVKQPHGPGLNTSEVEKDIFDYLQVGIPQLDSNGFRRNNAADIYMGDGSDEKDRNVYSSKNLFSAARQQQAPPLLNRSGIFGLTKNSFNSDYRNIEQATKAMQGTAQTWKTEKEMYKKTKESLLPDPTAVPTHLYQAQADINMAGTRMDKDDFYARGDGNQSIYSSVEDAQSVRNDARFGSKGSNFQHYVQNSNGRKMEWGAEGSIPRAITKTRSSLQSSLAKMQQMADLRRNVQSQLAGGVNLARQGSVSSKRSMSVDSFGSASEHVKSVLSLRNARGSVLQQVGGASLTQTSKLADQLRTGRQSAVGSDYFNDNI